jgi:hypothetical protein
MLIDTRDSPEPDRDRREPWLLRAVGRLGWPFVILWLCVASVTLGGWPGVGCIFAAIGLIAWRCDKLLPPASRDGLSEYRQ